MLCQSQSRASIDVISVSASSSGIKSQGSDVGAAAVAARSLPLFS